MEEWINWLQVIAWLIDVYLSILPFPQQLNPHRLPHLGSAKETRLANMSRTQLLLNPS